MNEQEKQRLYDLVEKATDGLGEHFDSVRIFVTKHEDGSTLALTRGNGNNYAQIGQVSEWIDADRASTNWNAKPEPE